MENKTQNIKVAVRIRPLQDMDLEHDSNVCIGAIRPEMQVVAGADSVFTFDNVFDHNTQQSDIYDECVKELVEAACNGFNATILAYGQTGSGKTWTMGSASPDKNLPLESYGIIPRVIQDLFRIIKEKEESGESNSSYRVHVQFLEIYGEDVRDLLDNSKTSKVSIRETTDGELFIAGAREEYVASFDEMMHTLDAGTMNRSVASTKMNLTSSRSHAIFTVLLEQVFHSDGEQGPACRSISMSMDSQDPADATSGSNSRRKTASEAMLHSRRRSELMAAKGKMEVRRSKFHFVDLAGSERAKRTGAAGQQLKEGININQGLLALGNVISALGDEKKLKRGKVFVPYRDSKLTRMLQDSLGGNSKTLMICCVSPALSNLTESINALRYANRARNIKNKPVLSRDATRVVIDGLKRMLNIVSAELYEARMMDGYVNVNNGIQNGLLRVLSTVNGIADADVEMLLATIDKTAGTGVFSSDSSSSSSSHQPSVVRRASIRRKSINALTAAAAAASASASASAADDDDEKRRRSFSSSLEQAQVERQMQREEEDEDEEEDAVAAGAEAEAASHVHFDTDTTDTVKTADIVATANANASESEQQQKGEQNDDDDDDEDGDQDGEEDDQDGDKKAKDEDEDEDVVSAKKYEKLEEELSRSEEQYNKMKAFYESKLGVLAEELTMKEVELDELQEELNEVKKNSELKDVENRESLAAATSALALAVAATASQQQARRVGPTVPEEEEEEEEEVNQTERDDNVEVVQVVGQARNADGVPHANKTITCFNGACPTVTTTTSEEGVFSVQLQPDVLWTIELSGISFEEDGVKTIEVIVPKAGILTTGGQTDIVTKNEAGLSGATADSLRKKIAAYLDAAEVIAKTLQSMLNSKSTVQQVTINANLAQLRKHCNMYAQSTVCLKKPPAEFIAMHEASGAGGGGQITVPIIAGPEVDALEQDLYFRLMETQARPLDSAGNTINSNNSGSGSNSTAVANQIMDKSVVLNVDMFCFADKYSVGSRGLFSVSNWKRRRFTLNGCVLTYFNGTNRAGVLVVKKDTIVHSDVSTAIHPQCKHLDRELVLEFMDDVQNSSKLLIRFDNAAIKSKWSNAVRDLVDFLKLTEMIA